MATKTKSILEKFIEALSPPIGKLEKMHEELQEKVDELKKFANINGEDEWMKKGKKKTDDE